MNDIALYRDMNPKCGSLGSGNTLFDLKAGDRVEVKNTVNGVPMKGVVEFTYRLPDTSSLGKSHCAVVRLNAGEGFFSPDRKCFISAVVAATDNVWKV